MATQFPIGQGYGQEPVEEEQDMPEGMTENEDGSVEVELELDESDREIVLMHMEATGEKITPESIQEAIDAYIGQYDSLSDFVDEQLEQCEEYHALPNWIRYAIDNDTAWNCSLTHDYLEEYNPRTRTYYIFTL